MRTLVPAVLICALVSVWPVGSCFCAEPSLPPAVKDASGQPDIDPNRVLDESQKLIIDSVEQLFRRLHERDKADAFDNARITINPQIIETGLHKPEVEFPLPSLDEISQKFLDYATRKEAANSFFWDFATKNFSTHTPPNN